MAVITISRQVAALGDEIAKSLAEKLGYKFVDRKQIESKIVELGFPLSKLPKYDERKPGFFASLAKDRDEYLNYLQLAELDAAKDGNCILIGRASFIILDTIQNLVPIRFVANDSVRLERLKKEFNWTDKQAQGRINESDTNRKGFHKSFFNIDNEQSHHYLLTLNTALLDVTQSVQIIESLLKTYITPEKESAGKQRIQNLLKAQTLVNKLVFEHKLNINFLHADINLDGTVITLQGVADSHAAVEKAIQISAKICPSCEIKSAVSIVQDFKMYHQ